MSGLFLLIMYAHSVEKSLQLPRNLSWMKSAHNHKKQRIILLTIIFIVPLLINYSCVTLKSIQPANLSEIPEKRTMMRIHSDTTIWILKKYEIENNVISGEITKSIEKNQRFKVVDVYAAPFEAVKVSEDRVTLSVNNIGKIDYSAYDTFSVVAISILGSLIIILPIISAP